MTCVVNQICNRLKDYPSPGGHIYTCNICSKSVADLYKLWQEIKRRCYDVSFRDYKDYGAKDIKMDPKYVDSFYDFYVDIGIKPSSDHILKRIDKKIGYLKSNLVWSLPGDYLFDPIMRWDSNEGRCHQSMKSRCFNSKNKSFDNYGGRGITVCERWLGPYGYRNFIEDMGPRPSSMHSIERKDNDGNYEPGNCRWATKTDQVRNRRCNKLTLYQGRMITLAELHQITGISYPTLYRRYNEGLTGNDLIATPRSYTLPKSI